MAGEKKAAVAEKQAAAPKAPAARPAAAHGVPRLLERYRRQILPALMQEFRHANPYDVPRVTKVVINMGVGAAAQDPKFLDLAIAQLTQIAGQRPVTTRAKKAISNFKIRKDQAIGCKVTLRGARMYEFLDRLLNVAMPRIRDFRGVSPTAFDRGGNYTFGIAEQAIFPEVDPDTVQRAQGMDITLCTTAKTVGQARALLTSFGLPFAKP